MPLPLYRRRASSPSSKGSPKGSTQGLLHVEKSGRKSSLVASLQSLAKNTFHSKTRRSEAEKAAATGGSTTPTPGSRSTSLPLKSKRSFFSRRLSSSSVASSASSQATIVPAPESPIPPVPPVPPIPNRKYPSRIPTPVRAAGPRMPPNMASGGRKEGQSSVSPDERPFVGYRDVKSLSAVDKGKGKAREENVDDGKDRRQATSGYASSRNNSPSIALNSLGARQPGRYNSSLPLPKSSSSVALLGSSRRATVLPPVTTCNPVHGHTQATNPARPAPRRSDISGAKQQPARTMPKKQGGYNNKSSGSPSERAKSRHCITSQQHRVQRPAPALPKSMTFGNLTSEQQASRSVLLSPTPPPVPERRRTAKPMKGANTNKVADKQENKENINTTKAHEEEQTQAKAPLDDFDEDDPRLVKTAQPQQYWLGRFTTLMSSFQFEAAFNEPDPATGYGIAGNRLEGVSVNLDDYHTKRAFIVLERMCVTPEAIASFGEFREAYARRFGRQFSERCGGNIDAAATKNTRAKAKQSKPRPATQSNDTHESQGGKEGTNEETGVKQIFKSVRKSLG